VATRAKKTARGKSSKKKAANKAVKKAVKALARKAAKKVKKTKKPAVKKGVKKSAAKTTKKAGKKAAKKQVVAKKLPFVGWAEQVKHEAQAWADHAEGHDEEALHLLREIAEKQRTGVFGASGDLPAREMLADMLLDMNRPEQALDEYEASLRINPNRFDSLYGAARAAEAARGPREAANYYRELLKVCAGTSSTRPELAHAQSFLSQVEKEH